MTRTRVHRLLKARLFDNAAGAQSGVTRLVPPISSAALVNSTRKRRRVASTPSAIANMVLPVPIGPARMTSSASPMYWQLESSSIFGRDTPLGFEAAPGTLRRRTQLEIRTHRSIIDIGRYPLKQY